MREEVAGGWRKLHNEELHNFHSLPHTIRVIKSRRMRWVRYVPHMGDMSNAYKVLIRKLERKRLFAKSRHRWADNVEMGLKCGSGYGPVVGCC